MSTHSPQTHSLSHSCASVYTKWHNIGEVMSGENTDSVILAVLLGPVLLVEMLPINFTNVYHVFYFIVGTVEYLHL